MMSDLRQWQFVWAVGFTLVALMPSTGSLRAAETSQTIEVASYYFPNYHPGDPRNAKMPGKGPQWSEWELVKAATPRYPGHQQPKVPLWGYSDESDPAVMAQKLDAAADHGIDAFIFDWYHYNDGPFLNGCVDDGYLKAPNRERVKFALMWANHDWLELHPSTRNTTQPLLFPGKVSPESFDRICDHVIKDYFLQPTYWKIDGRPYFSFYDMEKLVQSFESVDACRAALDGFRKKAVAAGLPGIHLNAVVWGKPILPGENAPTNIEQVVRDLGFDSATSYVWVHHASLPERETDYNRVRDDYFAYWEKAEKDYDIPYIPNVTMGWDSSPRTNQKDEWGNWGYPFTNNISGNTPERFRTALEMAKERVLENVAAGGALPILNINCWNEWTEGSYLEPDTVTGMKYLEAVRSVLGDGAEAVSVNPAVKSGLEISVKGNELTVSPGSAVVGSEEVVVQTTATLQIPAADIVSVQDEKSTFPENLPHMWLGGNLRKVRTANAISGSLIPESLRVRLEDGTILEREKDYVVDDTWASVACAPGGRMTSMTPVLVDYDYSLMRMDGIDVTPDGRVTAVQGTPHLVCPVAPAVTTGALRLANVFQPYKSKAVEPWQVFEIGAPFKEPSHAEQVEMSKPVRKTLEKLRRGEPVTIVTWGDSVTVGGDTSKPELAYANLFISRLKERFPGAKIKYVNAGIGGTTTEGRFPAFEKEVMAHKPDLVTIEFVNDIGLTSATVKKNWDEALTRIKAAGAEAVVITPHFTSSFIAMHPHPRGPENRPNVQLMKDIAARHGVALADTSKRWAHLEYEGIPYVTLLYNGINHPNDLGHELFVKDLMNLFPAKD